MERRGDRAQRGYRGGRGQPLLPSRSGGPARVAAQQHHLELPVEGHRALPHAGGRRRREPRRGVVLPRSKAGGGADQRPHRVLEGRRDRMSEAAPRRKRIRTVCRWALALLYLVAAGFHLAKPHPFVGIVPPWVPWPDQVVLWTGLAEGSGALALLQPWSPRLRRAAGAALALYAVCVYPANVQHMLLDLGRAGHGPGLADHLPPR